MWKNINDESGVDNTRKGDVDVIGRNIMFIHVVLSSNDKVIV